jgi:hypothetical protein
MAGVVFPRFKSDDVTGFTATIMVSMEYAVTLELDDTVTSVELR